MRQARAQSLQKVRVLPLLLCLTRGIVMIRLEAKCELYGWQVEANEFSSGYETAAFCNNCHDFNPVRCPVCGRKNHPRMYLEPRPGSHIAYRCDCEGIYVVKIRT